MSHFRIKPPKYNSIVKLDDYIVWGGSMTRSPDGKSHLFLSIWPRETGFEGWVLHSQVGYAVANNPDDEFKFKGLVFKGRGVENSWDRDVIHNPTVHYWDNKFYLYYTGNYGNGEYWNHRNNQRIGVAVTENPQGPWQRLDHPLLDVNKNSWDCLITTNPSVAKMPDGRYIMIYKTVDDKAPPPICGPVLHGVAFADSPTGPFVKHPEPIFTAKGINFPGEDPYVFAYGNKLYTILKDIACSYYPDKKKSLVLFESDNGIDWNLTSNPLVTSREIKWEDGKQEEFFRLERPQLYLENGIPKKLFTAVKPKDNQDDAFNIHFDVEFT